MIGSWQIIEVGADLWAWECENADGTSMRVGVFKSRTDCLADARRHGYQPIPKPGSDELQRASSSLSPDVPRSGIRQDAQAAWILTP